MRRPASPFLFLAALLLAVTAWSARPVEAQPGSNPYVPGEVIIKFKDVASESQKDQVRQGLGGPQLKGFGRIRAELRKLGSTLTVEEAVSQYRGHPAVQYIEPNYIVNMVETPNDPMFNSLYGLLNTGQTGGTAGADIHATTAWDVTTGSSQVVIGVIDTGVDYTHPDLAANIWTNPGEIAGNGIDDDNNGKVDDVRGWDFRNEDNDPMDDQGHGSHVSGTIGAVGNNGVGVVGVCWNVKIMPLKFLSASGSGTTADAVEAVIYATQMGVRLTSNSWGGGGFSQALFDAISDANAHGILFVAAAGNSSANTDTSPHYPSAYNLPNIISVAATDHNDQLASFSNYGATTVDIAAPGVNILSTFPGNNYGSISGTSMATPHVAGACGLVFARSPSIGHLDAKSLLLNFADPKPGLAGKVLTGGRLNAFMPIADPDSIPPAAIADVAVTQAGSNWLMIGWTATGDDDVTGRASRYIVKYSAAPIDAGNFDAATTAPSPPDPDPVGTPQAMRISGLDFSTTYYVAVKALDEFGNASPISNVANGTTLGIPDIAAAPLSLTETLLSGATSTQTLTLSNVGQGTLDFVIPAPQLVTVQPSMASYVELAKGEIDTRPGILGFGGPDGFGYRWADSDDPAGPAFSWTDISATGTLAISTGDDVNQGPFPIGFTFPFYGVEYTTFRVTSNGWLSFTSTSTTENNQPLPNSGAPTALVAPFWDDLNPTTSGDVHYRSDGSRLIVQWTNVAHYETGGPYTFQAVLHSDGTIDYQYLSMAAPTNSATIGIQNAARTDGLQVAFNTPFVHDSLAVRIAVVPQWVTVAPTEGTIFAPNSTGLTVSLDAAGLLGGGYDGIIRVLSNDPDESPFEVPVHLQVIGAPDVALAPSSIDFGAVFLGATPTETIQVQNPGTDVLHVSSVTVDQGVYSVTPTSFDVPPRSSVAVQVTFAPTVTGTYPATLTVASDDPDEPSVSLPITGQGVPPPDFSVDPTSLSSNLFTGNTETQTLTLGNSGGANLEWSASVEFLAPSATFTLTPPDATAADVDGGPAATNVRTTPIQAELADLAGIDILWDRSNGESTTSLWTTIVADLTSRGATVTQSTAPITAALLANYDVIWITDTGSTATFDAAEIAAISPWLNAGGALLLEGDNAATVTAYNQLLAGVGSGILFSQTDGATGTSSNIHPHPTTQGVSSIFITAATASIGTLSGGAGRLVDDINGLANTAFDQIGGGRIVAAADELFQNSRMGSANNQLFGNQVMDWLVGTTFLTLSPTSGTVPPGGSQNVSATFTSVGLFGGLYQANIHITTNDPLALETTVPAALQVTGAPNLVLDPTSIDFGSVYVGYPDLHDFQIHNSGTDVLTITDITSSSPEFSVFLGGGSFPIQVGPLTSTVLQVRFAPPAAGPFSGTLTIASNDPDTPSVPLAVAGSGLLPPVASVAPTSLHADLLTGQTAMRQFTISNTGQSDLNWSTTFVFQAATQDYTLTVPEPAEDIEGGSGGSEFRTTPIRVQLADLTGIDILWDRSNGQTTTSSWTTIVADLTSRGATVTQSTAAITPELLAGYDVLWIIDPSSTATFDAQEIAAITPWLNSGGGILLEGDNTASVAIYNQLLAGIGSGVVYSGTDNATGTSTNIHPHATTENVASIFLTAATASIESIAGAAGRLVDDINGRMNTVYDVVGAGRIVAAADEIFQNARMGSANNQLFGNQVIDWLASPSFLSVDPPSGVVPAGGSAIANVEFDAGGLLGGAYATTIRVNSNDPLNGALDIAASLNVTGVPRIAITPASLDFGNAFVGYPETLTLSVKNEGTDVLSVTAVTAGLPDYTVDDATFDVGPFQTRNVVVSFTPQSVGDRSSSLSLTSNDPSSPHTVSVAGSGILRPIASVSPDSVHADLLTGQTATRQVTLANTGGSDLQWSSQLRFFPPNQAFSLTAPDPSQSAEADGGTMGTGFRTTPIQALLANLTGVRILYDRSNGQATPTSYTTMFADLTARGATVTASTEPITPALLANYDVYWSIDTGSSASWDATELSALNAWVHAGGGVLLEGDNTSSVEMFNELLANLGAGITYSATDNASGTTTNIHPHQTTEGVTGIYITAAVASIGSVTAPAGPLVDDINGLTNTAHSQVGAGRIVATADELFLNSRMGMASNQLFGNQVFDWLSAPVFLAIQPASGVVPAGGSTPIELTYDAAGLFGGDYKSEVYFLTNDPGNGSLRVAATLHVTGVPRIELTPTSLAFGDAYIGYPETMSLTVKNSGTDVLSVSGITSGAPDYSVDSPSFTLNPFEARNLTVTFNPTTAGDRSSTLSFASNDPDSPHSLPVSGTGVVPPVISVSPDSLEGAALPGGSKTKILTLSNTGGSDLNWNASALSLLPAAVNTTPSPETGKDQSGNPSDVVALAYGGPDAFGYRYADSDDPQGTPFDWTDISGVGTPIPFTGDDQNQGPFPLPFPFTFYGNTFTSFRACTNGWISFTSTRTNFTNTVLPNAGTPTTPVPENMIAAFWDDLTFSSTGDVYYHYDGTKFIIQYHNVPRLTSGGPYTFQILLYPSGTIDIQYLSMNGTRLNEATVGIQNATKDIGLQVAFNQPYVKNNLRVRFTAQPGWLTASPLTGTIPAGGSMDIAVTMNAAELEAGNYSGQILLASNDPATPAHTTPVLFHVGSILAADADVDPDVVNVQANGAWVTALVELPAGYDPTDIVLETVRCNGIPANSQASTIGDFNGNGIPDRQFKFPMDDVMETLEEGDSSQVVVLGEIEDTIYFIATEYVRVLNPRLHHPNGGETLAAGATMEVRWTNPLGFENAPASLWFSRDAGVTWTLVADGITGQSYLWQVPIEPTAEGMIRVYIQERGARVVGFDTSDQVFGINTAITGVDLEEDLPKEYGLRFASANPARGPALMELALPKAGPVDVRVYDVRGALVRELVDKGMPAGRHRITWDNRSASGTDVGTGVYFVRAHAGGKTFTKRLAVVR